MKSEVVVINLENGLEASPIALLVQVANRFESKVYLETGAKKVNAKSIMGMMSLGLDNGEEVTVSVDGADEDAALEGVKAFLTGAGK